MTGKLFKSSVARLKLFHADFKLADGSRIPGVDNSDSDSDNLFTPHDHLKDKFRASTKPRRVRRDLNKVRHVPELLEPFHGAKSEDLRRSERIRLKNAS